MEKQRFTPEAGMIYRNHGGGTFICMGIDGIYAIMRNILSGWTFRAAGTVLYENGAIEWDYSIEGHFEKRDVKNVGDTLIDTRDVCLRMLGSMDSSIEGKKAWYWTHVGEIDMAYMLGLINQDEHQLLRDEWTKHKPEQA